jgi:hypothetical protein
MAELGDDDKGNRRSGPSSAKTGDASGDKESDGSAGSSAQSGVKIERKGQQTVIHVTSLLTGMPTTTGAAPVPSPAAAGYPPTATAASGYYGNYGAQQWSGYPAQAYAQPQAIAAGQQQWGYYQGAPMDPSMAAYYNSDAYVAYAAQYAQYQQQAAAQSPYAQSPSQASPPPPPSEDVYMG